MALQGLTALAQILHAHQHGWGLAQHPSQRTDHRATCNQSSCVLVVGGLYPSQPLPSGYGSEILIHQHGWGLKLAATRNCLGQYSLYSTIPMRVGGTLRVPIG